jgi:hypothetical protein
MNGLSWNETSSPNATAVVRYEGPRAPTGRFIGGTIGVVTGVGVAVLAHSNKANGPIVQAVPMFIGLVSLLLAAQSLPGSRGGRIEIAAGRMRVSPSGLPWSKIDVPLAEVESFATGLQRDPYSVGNNRDTVQGFETRSFVYLYTRDGRRYTLATFGEEPPAQAMVQNLEELVSRLRAQLPPGDSAYRG